MPSLETRTLGNKGCPPGGRYSPSVSSMVCTRKDSLGDGRPQTEEDQLDFPIRYSTTGLNHRKEKGKKTGDDT
jgi:hypothetical protein